MKKDGSRGQVTTGRWQRWLLRGPMALGVAALGLLATADSFARFAVKVDPARAHAMAGHNGIIAAAFAAQQFADSPQAGPSSTAARLAQQALARDPTSASAVTTLAFQAQLARDERGSQRLFDYAMRLSRRNLRVHMWAIESAVVRGDIDHALLHYDLALRTSRDAQDALFPTLSAALSEARIRAGVLRLLAGTPVWSPAFVEYAARYGSKPLGTKRLFDEGRAFLPVTGPQKVALIHSLFGRGETDEAWSYYRSFHPGAERLRSRDPAPTAEALDATPFDWSVGADMNSFATISTERGGDLLDFTVPPSVGGVLLQQSQLFPPGAYRLSGSGTVTDPQARSQPYWVLSCADGRELGRVPLSGSGDDAQAFEGQFTVPQGCPVQSLALVVRATDDIAGVSGRIRAASLRAVR